MLEPTRHLLLTGLAALLVLASGAGSRAEDPAPPAEEASGAGSDVSERGTKAQRLKDRLRNRRWDTAPDGTPLYRDRRGRAYLRSSPQTGDFVGDADDGNRNVRAAQYDRVRAKARRLAAVNDPGQDQDRNERRQQLEYLVGGPAAVTGRPRPPRPAPEPLPDAEPAPPEAPPAQAQPPRGPVPQPPSAQIVQPPPRRRAPRAPSPGRSEYVPFPIAIAPPAGDAQPVAPAQPPRRPSRPQQRQRIVAESAEAPGRSQYVQFSAINAIPGPRPKPPGRWMGGPGARIYITEAQGAPAQRILARDPRTLAPPGPVSPRIQELYRQVAGRFEPVEPLGQ